MLRKVPTHRIRYVLGPESLALQACEKACRRLTVVEVHHDRVAELALCIVEASPADAEFAEERRQTGFIGALRSDDRVEFTELHDANRSLQLRHAVVETLADRALFTARDRGRILVAVIVIGAAACKGDLVVSEHHATLAGDH